MSRLLAFLALLPLGVPACFSPSYPSGGFACGPAGECPSDFHCSAQLTCVANGGLGGGPDAPSAADAPVVVAPDAIVLMPDAITAVADAPLATPDARLSDATAVMPPDAHPVDAVPPADAAPVLVDLQLIPSGPGIVVASPAGATCGTNCYKYTAGASVTITARPTAGFSLAGWSGGGCEQVGDGPCVVVVQHDTEVDIDFCRFNKVVDPAGLETNPGTCAKPLKTISHAIDLAVAGDLIGVNPGTYSAASGEFFPIIVPENVSLIGDELHKGATTIITGGDVAKGVSGVTTTLQPQQTSVVAGFTITNAAAGSSMGVVVTEQGVTLRNDTITGCAGSGVYIPTAGHDLNLIDDVVSNNARDGVLFYRGGANGVFQANTFVHNNIGIEVDACVGCVPPDLGGGSAGSTGGNIFVCNTMNDLWTNVGSTLPIVAQANAWDHQPPTTGCEMGEDICLANGGVVDSTGATLAAGACP